MPKRMTLDKLATIIKGEFDAVDTKIAKMATKDDLAALDKKLSNKIDETEEKLSNQIGSLRGELILVVRKEDKKINSLIQIMLKNKLLAAEDAKELLSIHVFPRIEVHT